MVWYLWLKEGDCNSKFFHLKATASQRKNLIPSLNIDGVDVIDQNKKEDSTWEHFNNLLGTYHPTSAALNFQILGFQPCDLYQLDRDFTEAEVKHAIFELHPKKAPGPDGYMGHFCTTCWDLIKSDFMAAIMHF